MKTKCFFLSLLFLQSLPFSAQENAQESITLLFVGDLMQHIAQVRFANTESGFDYSGCFKYVRKEISSADIAVGNLETTISGPPYEGYPAFSAPPEFLLALKEAGFDILLTANNHCLDRGKAGLESTIITLDSLNILHTGTFINNVERDKSYPLFIEKNKIKIAFLNYTYGTNDNKTQQPNVVNRIDKETIKKDIRKAQESKADAIIACLHWGNEYDRLPTNEQKELSEWLLSEGVSHIIGAHSHIVQPMEMKRRPGHYDMNIVAYSLGNFISNMVEPQTDGGAILKMTLTKTNGITKITKCNYSLTWTSRPRLSGKSNFIVYPVANPQDSLTTNERNRMNSFTRNVRKRLDQYNIGIEEYIFE